jgi:hypothetical protein
MKTSPVLWAKNRDQDSFLKYKKKKVMKSAVLNI